MVFVRFFLLAGLFLGFFSGAFSCVSEDTSDYWPVLTVDGQEFDFGTVRQGEVIRHSFRLTNQGKGHLRLIGLETDSRSVEAYPLVENLAPGESTEIRAVFDTDLFWGEQKQKILVDTNDPDRLEFPMYLHGFIKADYELEPRLLYARRKDKSRVHFGAIALRNVTGKPMKILRLDSGDDRVKPSFTPPFKGPVLLADGQTVSIDAKFRPDLPRKSGKDEIKVYVEGRERPIVIPVRIKRSK